jgi:hypothetical protein
VFRLHAAKRGTRLDWKDADNQKCYQQLIKHHSNGVICWLAEGGLVPNPMGQTQKTELDDFISFSNHKAFPPGWMPRKPNSTSARHFLPTRCRNTDDRILRSKIMEMVNRIETISPVDVSQNPFETAIVDTN